MPIRRTSRFIPLALGALAAVLLAAAPALAKTYTDVPKSSWAYSYIKSVTDRTVQGQRLLDDYETAFKPEQPITREELARALVLASGHYGEKFPAVDIPDVPRTYPLYAVIEQALKLGYLGLGQDGSFHPQDQVTSAAAETAVVRWIRDKYPTADWTLLSSMQPSRWEPNAGWKTLAPAYLPYIIASRQLELRFNHSDDADGQETLPTGPIDRAEVAYMLYRGYALSGAWQLYGLSDYKNVTFPPLSDRQKQIVRFALKFVGYPYVWAGEWPTKNSPYGPQAQGGFDCSGLVFYIMKMHFGYDSITVNQRGGHDMAAVAKPRITRQQLKCGDLIFFGPKGPASSVISIYHAALYLGRGWFVQSTGSSDGVTISSLNTSTYWKNAFAWGRRVLRPSELYQDPTATPTPTASPTASSPAQASAAADPAASLSPPASPAP